MYRRGRSQPMRNFGEAAYINRLRKQYSISTAGSLQFCCIKGYSVCLYEGMTHRPVYILLYSFISTCSQPSSMQLQSINSDHRRDVEIKYNFSTKCTVKQMALFRINLSQTAYSKEKKENVAL